MADRAITPNKAAQLLKVCMDAGRPVFLAGPPGIGKSDLMEQIGNSYLPARPVIDMRLLLMDPTDLKGIPYFDSNTGTMKWAQSSELPTEGNGLDNAILFLDEMNAAPPSVQAAAYQLILNRRVGEYHLPAGVSIVAAGNRESDRGVVYRMPSPLANRFVHFDMEASYEDWEQWALLNEINPDVIGFLKKHAHKLFTFDPKSPDKAFATPRSWSFVSDIISSSITSGLSEHDLTTMIAGTVGEGTAIEFEQHRKFAAQLPDPLDVLQGKVKDLTCQEVSAHYSLVISLCYRLKGLHKISEMAPADRPEEFKDLDNDEWHKYVENYIAYMMANLQPEMIILGAATALRKKMFGLPINHRKVPSWTDLYKAYGDMVIGN